MTAAASRAARSPWAGGAGLLVLAACANPIVKPAAFDEDVLARQPLPASLLARAEGVDERVLLPGAQWLATDARERLTFASYRPADGPAQFCLVLECEPRTDTLRLLPLAPGETPLSVLTDGERRASLERAARAGAAPAGESALTLPLADVMTNRQLAAPIPVPRRILAVAANFPSHLEVDLAIPRDVHQRIAQTPPRLFQKYPPVPPPGSTLDPQYPYTGVIGPFDVLRFPETIELPADEAGQSHRVPTNLDYECEIGVVLGRSLTWDDVQGASDETLRAAIAGYVLISDVKARNPQVYERALARNQTPSDWSRRYLTGDGDTDLMLGNWDETTCAWWSHAASLGELASIGPWFVAAAAAGERLPPRAIACARTYAAADVRPVPAPKGRQADVFYLRQCTMVTEDPAHRDALLWPVPSILRAALDPEGAFAFSGGDRRLDPGDVISLGTPGGIVLTVSHRWLYRLLDFLLFWWDAKDWHDAFFGRSANAYLCEGDRLFLWAEGLGCQLLSVQRVPDVPTIRKASAGREAPSDSR